MTPECMTIYVEGLADLSDDQIKLCIGYAVRELKFFPKVSELRQLCGACQAEKADAEARAAWDALTGFVGKYVSNDVHGNYGPEHGWYSKYPELSGRILDTVRRTGGWRAYKCMTVEDFPFQQKRFLEEYAAWTAVQRIELTELIAQMPHLQLVAKPMDLPEEPSAAPKTCEQVFQAKPVPEPLADAQLRDRREMLRQQGTMLFRDGKIIRRA